MSKCVEREEVRGMAEGLAMSPWAEQAAYARGGDHPQLPGAATCWGTTYGG